MQPTLSIFIPTFNESEIIGETLERVSAFLNDRSRIQSQAEIIVCDNGSTDSTPEQLLELAKRFPNLRVLLLPERGAGRAFVEGVRRATGDWIVTLDADLSSGLEFLSYVEQLSSFADAVIGTKTFGRQRRTLFRVLGSQTYILITQYLFDLGISDFSLGSKAFRRVELLPFLEKLDHWTGHIFEIILAFTLRGKRVLQIGVNCEDTRTSRFNILHEAFYRFRHLARMYKIASAPNSWLRP